MSHEFFLMSAESSHSHPRTRNPFQTRPSTVIALGALLLASLLAVFLGGGPRQGGMGIFLAVAGVVLLLIRPSRCSPWSLWVLGLLLLGAVGFSLIPTVWWGPPEWSVNLRDIPGLTLPDRLSADPWATAFWVLLLFSSILTALYVLGSPLSSRPMSNLAVLAVLGCSVYAVLAWGVWRAGWNYPFFEKVSTAQAAYGFFPNRNHTAGFLLTGAIVSLGLIHRGLSRNRLVTAIIGSVAFTLLTSMILFFSISRGGLLFLLIGVVIWVLGLGRYRSAGFMLGGVGLFAVILVLFFSSGSGLLERLTEEPSQASHVEGPASSLKGEVLGDSRLRIARDTLPMIIDHPVSGTGLGTYAIVYPFYADKSLRDLSTALHPESDWLMLCSEGGIPALVTAMIIVLFLLTGIPGLKSLSGEGWPLRWAFLSAFFAELLHGFFDVPLHKPELGWWVLMLGGIGFGGFRTADVVRPVSSVIQRVLFIMGGLVIFPLGVIMIMAQWGGGEATPPFAVEAAQRQVQQLFGNGTDPAALQRAEAKLRETIARYPMSHQLYHPLASLILSLRKDLESAKVLFAIDQALWPRDANLPFEQGKIIDTLEPLTTATYWNEALGRQLRLDALPTSPLPRAAALYSRMISSAAGNEALVYRLPTLGDGTPELRMVWLFSSACSPSLISEAVNDASFMQQITPKDQGRLIERWYQRGDRNEVGAFLEGHPQYARTAIATRASLLVASAQEEQACKLLIDTFAIPIPEQPVASTMVRSADRDVPEEPLAASQYYLERGNVAAGRRLLGEAMKGSTRNEALRLRAVMEMRDGDWKGAFADLLAYLHGKGEL